MAVARDGGGGRRGGVVFGGDLARNVGDADVVGDGALVVCHERRVVRLHRAL